MEELLRKLNNHGIMANNGEHGKEIVKFFESIGAKINCTGNLYHHYHTLKDGCLECVIFEKPQHIITLEEAKKTLKIIKLKEKNQTAIDWLEKELIKRFKRSNTHYTDSEWCFDMIKKLSQQAKEMESEKNKKYHEMLEMLEKLVERLEENDLGQLNAVFKAKQLIKEATEL